MWSPHFTMFIIFPVMSHVIIPREELHEGSPCKGPGSYCARIEHCRAVDIEFQRKMGVDWDWACSEPDSRSGPLLVCCNKSDIRKERPSEQACREFAEEVSSKHGVVPLIRNGIQAKKGEFPHLAALGYSDARSVLLYIAASPQEGDFLDTSIISGSLEDSDVSWRCSGSLITHSWVLTAGHCILRTLRWVRLGAVSLDADDDHVITTKIAEKRLHPEFGGGYNDLGLLRLSTRIASFTDNIRPACLSQTDSVPDKLSIAGYGQSGPHGMLHLNQLMKGSVHTMPLPKCKWLFQPKLFNKFKKGLPDNVICARDNNLYYESCMGDSGGPLQAQDALSGQYMYSVLGVTSHGYEFCKRYGMKPTIYTKVFRYLPWIERTVWGVTVEGQ